MNTWVLGFFKILFVVCLVLSLVFIFRFVSNSLYEPYLNYDVVDNMVDPDDIRNSVDSMITDISNVVNDISNDLDNYPSSQDSG